MRRKTNPIKQPIKVRCELATIGNWQQEPRANKASRSRSHSQTNYIKRFEGNADETCVFLGKPNENQAKIMRSSLDNQRGWRGKGEEMVLRQLKGNSRLIDFFFHAAAVSVAMFQKLGEHQGEGGVLFFRQNDWRQRE